MRISTAGEYDPYLDDFIVFQSAGRILLTDVPARVYDPPAVHAEHAEILNVAPDDIVPLPFFNPPQTLPAFALLGAVGKVPGAIIWTTASLAALVAVCVMTARLANAPPRSLSTAAVLLGAVSSMPAYEVVLHGQTSFLLTIGLLLVFVGCLRSSSGMAGGAGLAILAIKPQLAILFILFALLSGQWRCLLVALSLHVLALALSLVIFGWAIIPDWIALMLEASKWEDENGIWVHAMFGWNGFVRAAVGPDFVATRHIAVLSLTIFTMWWALASAVSFKLEPELKFFVLTAASILVSPHLFAQDLFLLAAPLSLLAMKKSSLQSAWTIYAVGSWALTLAHFPWLFPDPDVLAINFVTLWIFIGIVACSAPAVRHSAISPLRRWRFTA